MAVAGIYALFCLFDFAAAAPPLQQKNINVTVPQGTTYYPDSNLFCPPADAKDIILFFLGNYAAHVATVVTLPGEPSGKIFLTMICALIFPLSGIHKCIRLLGKFTLLHWKRTPLKNALRAGALCEVIRTQNWKPAHGNRIRNVIVSGSSAAEENKGKAEGSQPNIEMGRIEDLTGGPILGKTADSAGEEIHQTETSRNNRPNGTGEPHADSSPQGTSNTSLRFAWDVDVVDGFLPATGTLAFRGRTVHGCFSLPPGYALSIVPEHATVCPISEIEQNDDPGEVQKSGIKVFLKRCGAFYKYDVRNTTVHSSEISSSYNILGIAAAIFQLLFGAYTLYKVKGDQLQRYGFTAFGLTVAPYMIMSLINLITAAVTPSYSMIYLVKTSVMEEAIRRGAVFEGEVGKIADQTSAPVNGQSTSNDENSRSGDIDFHGHEGREVSFTDGSERPAIWGTNVLGQFREGATASFRVKASPVERPPLRRRKRQRIYHIYSSIFISLLPLVVFGCFSHFKKGSETSRSQMVVTISWLCSGIIYGAAFISYLESFSFHTNWVTTVICTLYLLYGCVFSVKETILVCKELKEFGSCVRLE